MLTKQELSDVEARVRDVSGSRWRSGRSDDGAAVVLVDRAPEPPGELRLTRDGAPAAEADVDFVAHSRDDVLRLLDAVRGRGPLAPEELQVIEARCRQASPGPWRAFLEEDGGIGGCNVMWVGEGDFEPDLYLWLDGEIAPGGDFTFVAAARQDIPALLTHLNGR